MIIARVLFPNASIKDLEHFLSNFLSNGSIEFLSNILNGIASVYVKFWRIFLKISFQTDQSSFCLIFRAILLQFSFRIDQLRFSKIFFQIYFRMEQFSFTYYGLIAVEYSDLFYLNFLLKFLFEQIN